MLLHQLQMQRGCCLPATSLPTADVCNISIRQYVQLSSKGSRHMHNKSLVISTECLPTFKIHLSLCVRVDLAMYCMFTHHGPRIDDTRVVPWRDMLYYVFMYVLICWQSQFLFGSASAIPASSYRTKIFHRVSILRIRAPLRHHSYRICKGWQSTERL